MEKMQLIHINEEAKEFHLSNGQVSYIFRVEPKIKQLEQLFFGKSIKHRESFSYLVERENRPANNLYEGDHTSALEHIKQEYPGFGTTDFRYPAHQVKWPIGDRVTHLEYSSHKVMKGKPVLEGLPATYTENDTEAVERLVLIGLDPEKRYAVHPMQQERYGDDLMAAGMIFADDVTTDRGKDWTFNRYGDFTSNIFYLTSKNDSEVN